MTDLIVIAAVFGLVAYVIAQAMRNPLPPRRTIGSYGMVKIVEVR